jgi:hypothetical protein
MLTRRVHAAASAGLSLAHRRAHQRRGCCVRRRRRTHCGVHTLPPPLLGTLDDPAGPFAHDTVTNRLPNSILRRTVELNADELDTCAESRRGLEALIETLVDGDRAPIALPDGDHADLATWWAAHMEPMTARELTWTQAPWFTSETLAYRHALAATGYYDPSRPLYGFDLFGREKWEGLTSSMPRLRELVAEHEHEAAVALEQRSSFSVLIALIHASLWGNQADSSLWAAGAHPELSATAAATDGAASSSSSSRILVDDSAILAAEILAGGSDRGSGSDSASGAGRIVIVCDNSGMELVCDLMLSRWLLQRGHASHIELIVKPAPFYVSDATVDDVDLTLSTLAADKSPALSRLGADLLTLRVTEKLSVRHDAFWSSPLACWEMPLARQMALQSAAKLVIVKGDLQYRKLLGNRHWPTTNGLSFGDIVGEGGRELGVPAPFPAPLLSLRTCKAPIVVGLESSVVAALDSESKDWRVDGTRGTVHYVPHAVDREAELL